MAEAASFGNIVNTLQAVRRDYQEQLKSIPQYEAFLLIESSTEKAAGALQGNANSSPSIAADVIDSLQFARNRFEQHMTCIPEYRVLVAMDKLINDVAADLGLRDADPASAGQAPEAADDAEPAVAAAAEVETESADEVEAEDQVAGEAEAATELEEALDAPSIAPLAEDDERVMDDDVVAVSVAEEAEAEKAEFEEAEVEAADDEDDVTVAEKAEA